MQILISINILKTKVWKPHKINLNIYLIKATYGTLIGSSYYYES